jgi:hypothetical protein
MFGYFFRLRKKSFGHRCLNIVEFGLSELHVGTGFLFSVGYSKL